MQSDPWLREYCNSDDVGVDDNLATFQDYIVNLESSLVSKGSLWELEIDLSFR